MGESDLGEDESADHCCPILKQKFEYQGPYPHGQSYYPPSPYGAGTHGFGSGSSSSGGSSSTGYQPEPHRVQVHNGTILVSNGTSYATAYAANTTVVVNGSSVYLVGGNLHGNPGGGHSIYSVGDIEANRTHSSVVINSNSTGGGGGSSSGTHPYGPVSVHVYGYVTTANGSTYHTNGMTVATPDYNEQYYFRCVIGKIRSGSTFASNIAVANQCIGSKAVCDWDQVPDVENCINGADELDCISIWPYYRASDPQLQRDTFGRYVPIMNFLIKKVACIKKCFP